MKFQVFKALFLLVATAAFLPAQAQQPEQSLRCSVRVERPLDSGKSNLKVNIQEEIVHIKHIAENNKDESGLVEVIEGISDAVSKETSSNIFILMKPYWTERIGGKLLQLSLGLYVYNKMEESGHRVVATASGDARSPVTLKSAILQTGHELEVTCVNAKEGFEI